MKKLLVFFLMLSLLTVPAFANGTLADGGIAPDSPFYFVDQFFDQFADELEVKEERISEIKLMIENEDYDSARIALKGYYELAEEMEREVSPDRRDEVIKSAEAIKQVLSELESQIPEEERDEFVEEILNQESDIETAAEIANKINELCTELSELDPSQYYEVCKTNEDSPKWQQELDADLTNEQIAEAQKFGEIMAECFETSGQTCRCEEIPFREFANACSEAAPLAVACDIEGDEIACEKLDQLELPKLPEHLEDVLDALEDDIKDSQYGLHMPDECVEAGATTPEECSKVMIEIHSPEECKEALLAADVTSEREGREICDKIMMEIHAPECLEAGITDPDDCEDFYDEYYEEYDDHSGGDFYVDFNCNDIEDPMERLDCYDKAATQVEGYYGFDNENYDGPCMTEEDWDVKKSECRELYGDSAGDEPIMGDSGQGYECTIDIICIDFGHYGDSGNCMTEEDWSVKKAECRELYGDNAGDEPIMGDSGMGYECPVDIICVDFGQYEEEYEYKEDYEDDKNYEDWMEGCAEILCPENTYCEYGECIEHPYSECSDGCHQECGDQNTDCVNDQCVCLGYGEQGPPPGSEGYEDDYKEDYDDFEYEEEFYEESEKDEHDEDESDEAQEPSHEEPKDSGSEDKDSEEPSDEGSNTEEVVQE